MLGNRGASLTTESSAAFPSAEDASPDSPHSNAKHSGGTTLIPLRRKCLFLVPAPSFQPTNTGCLSSPRPGLRAFFGEYLLVFGLHAYRLRVPLDQPFWLPIRKESEHGCGHPGFLTG